MFGPKPKRRRLDETASSSAHHSPPQSDSSNNDTEISLALLLSLHPSLELSTALETLLAAKGDVEAASALLATSSSSSSSRPIKRSAPGGQQTGLSSFLQTPSASSASPAPSRVKHPRKGETLHLYTPSAVNAATPTTLIPSFLAPSLANKLLVELLAEARTFPPPERFQLFDRAVISPHTACFFLREKPTAENLHHFSYQARQLHARQFTPSMAEVTEFVEKMVNEKMKPKKRWRPNAAFVNCYRGREQNVGWHTDELTYLGPKAIIASVSLGCEREFRIRRAVGKRADDSAKGNRMGKEKEKERESEIEGEGQYSIHLQHNSLLIMHGGMQEAWKHSISPARTLTPHPIAGDVRINITYRFYRDSLRPGTGPTCSCNLPTTLRPVFPKPGEPQKYFWSCSGGYVVDSDGNGCGFFQYANFDEDGELVEDDVAEMARPDGQDYSPRDAPSPRDVGEIVEAAKSEELAL